MESTEYIDFRQYWLIFRRRRLPAAVVFGSIVGLTALLTSWQKPVYEANGKLLIKTPNNVTSALNREESESDTQPIGGLGFVGRESDPLSTEIEVIRSAPILKQTIATLNLKDQQGVPLTPKKLSELLNVENTLKTDILELSYESTVPEEAATVVNKVMSLYLENNVVANRTEAAVAREFIAKQLPKTEATVSQAEVALRRFKEGNNVVVLEEEAKSAVAVIANLEDQVTKARAQLADANARIETLRGKLGMSSQEGIAASSLSQSSGVQKALEELQQVESQLAVERTRYQDAHPIVVGLRQRRTALQAQLQGRASQVVPTRKQSSANLQNGAFKQQLTSELVTAEAGRLGLARQVSALSNVLANHKRRANALPKLEQRQRVLERQLEAAQATYETLLRRLEEIRVEENRNVANARIVEAAAVPEVPVAPNPAKNLALGGLLGIMVAFGTALILEALDTSIKTVKQAREAFGYTLLGLIPLYGKAGKVTVRDEDPGQFAQKIVVRDLPRSSVSEAYWMLQANLKFLSSDQELKAIVVTSSVPQEGKSTTCANLAAALAQLGHKVLLVDADMRRPRQHHLWNLLNEPGLSNVLVGQAELRTAIKEVMVNLNVLTAGVVPPNPVALIDSQRMATLIENFSDNYDFVIIDTPALNVAVDASILGKMADGILLVVRPEVVDSASAAAAKELLEQSGQHVLGQVTNGVVPENKPYSDYYASEYHTQEGSPTREMAKAGRNGDRSS